MKNRAYPASACFFAQPSHVFFSLCALISCLGTSARGASATWLASPTDGNWIAGSTETNWGAVGGYPGSTSLTTSAQVATFNGPSTVTSIAINSASLNIGSIVFDGNAAAYTIGSTSGNALLLTSGGSIKVGTTISSFTATGITETINAPILLEPASSTTAGSYTFANNSADATNVLYFGGAISGGATTSSITLTLAGNNTGANTVKGAISNGSAASVGIVKSGAGNWILSGANTYTGITLVLGGTLTLSGANTGSTSTTIGSGGTLVLDLNGGSMLSTGLLTLGGTGGGAFVVLGNSSGASSQTLGNLAISANTGNTIKINGNGGTGTTLTLGNTWTRGNNSTLNIDLSSGSAVLASSPTVTNGLIVGSAGRAFVTVTDAAGTGFGTVDASGHVVRYTGATALLASGNDSATNYVTSGNFTLSTTTNQTLNTLQLDASSSSGTLTINTGRILSLTGKAILMTGANDYLIQSGQLGASGGEVIVHQYGTGRLIISSTIGASTASLTKDGSGTLVLTASNGFTNGTYILAGTLQLGDGGTVGALSVSSAITNNGNLTVNRSNTVTQGTDFSSAAITGIGSFTQAGSGTTTLNSANTFSGAVAVKAGVLSFNTVASGTAAQALGGGGAVTLGDAGSSSGTLQYTGVAGTLDKNLYAVGSGINTVRNSGSGLLTLSGSLVKNGTILALDGGATGINVTGVISGDSAKSDLYISGGTVTLSNVNTFNGPTYVYGNSLLVNGVTNALPVGTTLILGGTDNTNGTFDLNGGAQTVAGLSSQGSGLATVTNNGATSAMLTVSGGGTYGGGIQDGTSALGLSVSGGNLVLAGTNTYSGATAVSGGTLSVNGSITRSAVTVSSGMLAGSGTVGGSVGVTNGAVNGSGLRMGAATLSGTSTLSGTNTVASLAVTGGTVNVSGVTNSTGSITVSMGAVVNNQSGSTLSGNSVSVNSGATLNNNGTVSGPVGVAGLLSGLGTIEGSLTLSGTLSPGAGVGIATIHNGDLVMTTSAVLAMDVTGAGTAGVAFDQIKVSGAVTLSGILDLTSFGGLTAGQSIALILNTGSELTSGAFSAIEVNGVTQTFSGNNFTYNGTEYLITYNASVDGNANDITLSVVPEPGTWACAFMGGGLLLLLQRCRRRAI